MPQPLANCQDAEVIGAPFYLMRFVDGLVLRTMQDGEILSPDQAAELSDLLAQMMATIHGVDFAAVGLADFGRPDGYLARQLARWQRQWELSNTREMPGYDELVARLAPGLPESGRGHAGARRLPARQHAGQARPHRRRSRRSWTGRCRRSATRSLTWA